MQYARLSPEAREDLLLIWEYIALDNVVAADELLIRLYKIADTLAELPEVGRLRNDLKSGLRSFPVKSFTIFYTPIPHKGIRVERILQGNRDMPTLFQ